MLALSRHLTCPSIAVAAGDELRYVADTSLTAVMTSQRFRLVPSNLSA